MAARLDSVAHFICERGDWKVSNLQLQKMAYMAQMIFVGQNQGKRLFDADFQAWDYGPVIPELYAKVRMFGAGAIKNVFFQARAFSDNDPRRHILATVCDQLLTMRPGALVDITHWEKGAWAKNYVPGVRGISISDNDIADEYRARLQRQRAYSC